MQYRFGSFEVDDNAFQLSAQGGPVALEPKALQLLLYFLRHPGRLLRKQELLDHVWSDATVGENALTRCIAQIRKALNEDAHAPQYIATVPTVGYRFLAEVSATPAVSAASAIPASSPGLRSDSLAEEKKEDSIVTRRSALTAGLVCAGLVLLAAVGWLGWKRYEDHAGGAPVQVVVADFDGGSGDPVLDRTLQDVLRFELLQSPFVSVVPPGTVQNLMTQMRHDPAERLTAELARDVCERTGSQAVLHGSLARLGNRFVIMEEVTGCADNGTIGTAKENVGAVEDLPAAVGKIAAILRHDMGESRRMIARFNRPLSPENTNSLEALKAFSQAGYLNNLGKTTEATDLLKRAVALDPQFAAAYFHLYSFSFSTTDAAVRKAYLQKAYDLREFATEPTRLAITAYYEGEFTGDLDALLRTFHTWTNIYPHDLQAWQGLANVEYLLGEYPKAAAASKRALELDPENSMSYYGLASDQIESDDYEGARRTCETALRKGMDTVLIHRALLFLGHAVHDAALIAQQEKWIEAHAPSPDFLINDAYFALIEGRAVAADALFLRSEEAYRRQGDAALGVLYRQGSARAYFELGWPDKARAQLDIAPAPLEARYAPDYLIALAETGKPDLAESILQKELADHPQSTRWNKCFAPQIRATIDMLRHRPTDALAVMAPLNGTPLDSMAYIRGLAYMETNQLPQAEAQFHTVLDHPGVDPTSQELPLSQLQLARVLAKEGRRDDAIKQYQVFLALWKDADKDSSTLRAAQAELAAMRSRGL